MSLLLPAPDASVLVIFHGRSLALWEVQLPRVTREKTRF